MNASTEMMKAPVLDAKIVESIVLRGDISGLSPEQKVSYANNLARSVGLDPSTTPFKSLKLQGREVMYADKGTAEQLRSLHSVDIKIIDKREDDGIYYVTARATLPNGRGDEDVGAVPLDQARTKADRANAVMKAHTKAKRRVTLSILGLGMLDESELDTVTPDRFAALKPEDRPAARKPDAVEHPKEKKGEALGKVPAKIATIPAAILLAVKPLQGLDGIPLAEMQDDDLEFVREQMGKVREVWKVTAKSQRALDWLDALAKEATRLLEQRNGNPPPPDDDEYPADEASEDGEVRS